MAANDILAELVGMSRRLGEPGLDYAILGEGNTSARADADTFWVKGSGVELRTIQAEGFVRVCFDGVLDMLAHDVLSDGQVKAALEAARMDQASTHRPSVETVLHALALQVPGVNWVGHTHPTVVNAILCSEGAEAAIAGRLFPDEIVVCGPAPVYIPYTDPGVPLARAVHTAIGHYLDDYGERPKVILMQNHGLIALGATAGEVEAVTAMAVKAARVLLGTYVLGGPRFMTPEQVRRIHTRPDEAYRRRGLAQ